MPYNMGKCIDVLISANLKKRLAALPVSRDQGFPSRMGISSFDPTYVGGEVGENTHTQVEKKQPIQKKTRREKKQKTSLEPHITFFGNPITP